MDKIEQKVHEVVRRVSQQRSAALPSVENRHRLTGELGLTSLDIARVIAILEMELGVDPFTRHAAITDMRTLGDLCEAYRAGLGAPAREPVNGVCANSERRANARRSVGAAPVGERAA
jgi:acyl carrier protein